MIRTAATILLIIILAACGGRGTERQAETDAPRLSETEIAFMDNLRSLCGKSFAGEQTLMADGREDWAHYEFMMHVTVCEDERVHIPFHLNDDHSRTWLFLVEDGRLRFRHDHRHEDGTPEERTLYGGYADGTGNAFVQHFPADEYTIELLQDTFNRIWTIRIAEDLSEMKYQLSYHGEVVFEGRFDIANPVEK